MPNVVYLGQAYTTNSTKLSATESTIAASITTLAGSSEQPSQADLLQLQYQMQVFAFYTEFVSTYEKKVGEAFQGIVRNF